MAINKKIDLPMSTIGTYPNSGNLVGEYEKINELLYKTNRSNLGQISWESPTSGIIYRTSSSEDTTNINNKGETGLYNLLLGIYGGDGGFILSANDYNKIGEEINKNKASKNNEANNISSNHAKAVANNDKKISDINEQNQQINNYFTEINNLTSMVCVQDEQVVEISGLASARFTLPNEIDPNNVYIARVELLAPDGEFWTCGDKSISLFAYIKDGTREIRVFVYPEVPIYTSPTPASGTKCRVTYWYQRGGGY